MVKCVCHPAKPKPCQVVVSSPGLAICFGFIHTQYPDFSFGKAMVRWLFALMMLGVNSLQAEPCLLKVQAQHFPPRFIKVESATDEVVWQGFNAELYQQLADRMGCQLELLEIPFGRAMQMLADGELGMMSNVSKNAERAEFAHFIGPVSTERTMVVGERALLGKVGNLQQLAEVDGQIGLMQGVFYGQKFANELAQNPQLQRRLAYVGTSQQKLDLLLRGRIQLTFEDSLTLQQLYQQQVLDEQKQVALFTLYESSVYLALSKAAFDKDRLHQLEQAWQQLVADGTLLHLQQRYFTTADSP